MPGPAPEKPILAPGPGTNAQEVFLMQLLRSARWLMPALLTVAIPPFCHTEVLKGAGYAAHLLPALGQAVTPADQTPAPQSQAPEKPIANRKHLNVSVGPLKMHLPVSGKRALPNGNPNPKSTAPQQPAASWLPPVPVPPETTIRGNDQQAYQPPRTSTPRVAQAPARRTSKSPSSSAGRRCSPTRRTPSPIACRSGS